jgi:hypothetical protein
MENEDIRWLDPCVGCVGITRSSLFNEFTAAQCQHREIRIEDIDRLDI